MFHPKRDGERSSSYDAEAEVGALTISAVLVSSSCRLYKLRHKIIPLSFIFPSCPSATDCEIINATVLLTIPACPLATKEMSKGRYWLEGHCIYILWQLRRPLFKMAVIDCNLITCSASSLHGTFKLMANARFEGYGTVWGWLQITCYGWYIHKYTLIWEVYPYQTTQQLTL